MSAKDECECEKNECGYESLEKSHLRYGLLAFYLSMNAKEVQSTQHKFFK